MKNPNPFLFVAFSLFLLFSLSSAFGEEGGVGSDGKTLPVSGDFHYRVGMGKIDITPDIESNRTPFSGYFDRHKKPAIAIHDPLYARALAATDKHGNRFALVSVDLCYVNSEVRDRVIARLRPYGFTDDNVLIAATHTHSGFGGFDTRWVATALFGAFDPRLQDLAVFGISSAVLLANENQRPAKVHVAATDLPVGANRSRRDPAFSVDTGGGKAGSVRFDTEKYRTDRRLTVLQFTGKDGGAIGALFNYASHPTVLSPKSFAISADWPGVTCAKMEKALGPDSVVLFVNGSLGDAAPRPDWDTLDQEWQNVETYGNEIADRALAGLEGKIPLAGDRIRSRAVRKNFSNVVLRPLGKIKLTKSSSRIAYKRPDQPLQAIRLGSMVFLAVPGEPTTLVGEELKKNCTDGSTCLVVAPSNGYMGYFVVEEEWKEGGYAADSCMFGLKGTQNVIEGIAEAVHQVR